jgi:hypothetical protein
VLALGSSKSLTSETWLKGDELQCVPPTKEQIQISDKQTISTSKQENGINKKWSNR